MFTLAELTTENVNVHTEMLLHDNADELLSDGGNPTVGIENEWKSVSEVDEMLADGLENEWKSATDNETPAEGREIEDNGDTLPKEIEDIWVSSSDELPSVSQNNKKKEGIEEIWVSGSEKEDEEPDASKEDRFASGIENLWVSANEAESPATNIEDLWSPASDIGDQTPSRNRK